MQDGDGRTAAITGAAGFIGLALARRLADAGWRVRGLDLVDPPASQRVYESSGGSLAAGDVTDPAALRRLVEGADLVVHTAAIVAESGDWVAFDRVNAVAPRDVGLAAREAGASTYVHLSSVMVHGFDFAEGCDEDSPLDPAGNPYCASKIRSEALVLPLHDPGGFDVHVVRPGDVYGAGSVPWVRRPVEHLRNRTFLYVDSGVAVQNHVHVDNLVDAIEVLLDTPRAAGRPVIVTDGVRTTARDYYGRLAAIAGVRWAPSLPGPVAEAIVGAAAAALPARARRRLDLDRQSIRYLRRRACYSNARMLSYGWQPRVTLDDGMAECRDWLRSLGLVP